MKHLITAVLLASTPALVFAQEQPSGPVLTLEEAINLALRNNPQHLQQISARSRSGTALRSAYGALLPSVDSRVGFTFREGGSELAFGQQFGSPSDILSSNYSIGLGVTYSLASFMQPRAAHANLNAAEADVTASAQAIRAAVAQQYLRVLQAQATAALQDTLVANAQTQLELDRARQQVGAATILEVRQSEVQVARTQVAQLRARNDVEIQLLTLFQQIGVERPEGVRLVTEFPVTEPTFQLDDLLAMAQEANPALGAARARESASSVNVAVARSQWLPRLSFSTGWSGYSQKSTNLDFEIARAQAGADASRRSCLTTDSIRVGAGLAPRGNCPSGVLSPEEISAMRAANDQYPFDFQKSPFSYSIGISLPIFDGFRREEQIQNAESARNDARYRRREQELRLTTEVTTAYRNLLTAHQEIRMNEQAHQAARDALDLAQERYRVGAATYVEVANARGNFEQAATDLINSIYNFHTLFAQLEAAVGRPLR